MTQLPHCKGAIQLDVFLAQPDALCLIKRRRNSTTIFTDGGLSPIVSFGYADEGTSPAVSSSRVNILGTVKPVHTKNLVFLVLFA